MLPANLAKTRAAGRTAYGELVVLSGGPSAAASLGSVAAGSALSGTNAASLAASSSLRYAPYPHPATITGHHHHHHHNHHQLQQQQQFHQQQQQTHQHQPTHHHNLQQTPTHHLQPTHHIIPISNSSAAAAAASTIFTHYANAAQTHQQHQQNLYDAAVSYKRLLTAAAAASLHRSVGGPSPTLHHPQFAHALHPPLVQHSITSGSVGGPHHALGSHQHGPTHHHLTVGGHGGAGTSVPSSGPHGSSSSAVAVAAAAAAAAAAASSLVSGGGGGMHHSQHSQQQQHANVLHALSQGARSSNGGGALSYPLSELLGVQGLDVATLYGLPGLGL